MRWKIDLRHLSSSEKSMQSISPLQTRLLDRHWPFIHVNSSMLHEPVIEKVRQRERERETERERFRQTQRERVHNQAEKQTNIIIYKGECKYNEVF